MDILIFISLMVTSYLLGSIPFGLIVGKIKGVDIREHGSKNIGATNAIRVLGKKLGLQAFLLDVLKGALVILIVKLLEHLNVYAMPYWLHVQEGRPLYIIFGVAAILGHTFPVFLKFRGGKAVAASLGVVIALTPLAALLCLIVFIITLKLTGYSSIASTFAAFTVVACIWTLNYAIWNDIDYITGIIYSSLGALILIRHRKNYIRLLKGTENSFKRKKGSS